MRKHVSNFQKLEFIVVVFAPSPILLYSPLGFFLIKQCVLPRMKGTKV